MSERKILSIMPAANWFVWWHDDTEPDAFGVDPLVAWALIAEPTGARTVVGLLAGNEIMFADELGDIEYVPESREGKAIMRALRYAQTLRERAA